MQEFGKFIVDNWKIILEVILLILSVVLFILKKKPVKVVDSVKTFIVRALPTFINSAEKYVDVFEPTRKITGEEKMRMVLHDCYTFMIDELGVPQEDLCIYTSWLREAIEDILDTPQKKGEK